MTNPDAGSATNVELTLTFLAGALPDVVTMPGWVVEARGGGVWSLRTASLAGASSSVATVSWASLPVVDSIAITATLQADTTALTAPQTTTLTLQPSYAAWAAGLSDPGQGADPDGDGISNVVEYALGGDPAAGSLVLPGGQALLPKIALTDGGRNVDFSFPARTDATARGLSYVVETSADLVNWQPAAAGAGSTQSAAPFDPVILGFELRHWTWSREAIPAAWYIRLRVELNEGQ